MNYRITLHHRQLLVLAAFLAAAAARADDLPPAASKAQPAPAIATEPALYLHVDVRRMRTGQAASRLYERLESRLLDSLPFDIDRELLQAVDAMRVFSAGQTTEPVILVNGDFPPALRGQIIDTLFSQLSEAEQLSMHGRDYFAFGNLAIRMDGLVLHRLETGLLYLAFGERGQALITPGHEILEAFLARGFFPGDELPAQPDAGPFLAHAVLRPQSRAFSGIDAPWRSPPLGHITEYRLLVNDAPDMINIGLDARSNTLEAAVALTEFTRSLLALQALADMNTANGRLPWLDRLKISRYTDTTRFELALRADQLLQLID